MTTGGVRAYMFIRVSLEYFVLLYSRYMARDAYMKLAERMVWSNYVQKSSRRRVEEIGAGSESRSWCTSAVDLLAGNSKAFSRV